MVRELTERGLSRTAYGVWTWPDIEGVGDAEKWADRASCEGECWCDWYAKELVGRAPGVAEASPS